MKFLYKLRDSLLLKSLLMLFLTMCVACIVTYLLIYSSMHKEVYMLSRQILVDRASGFLNIYHNTELSLDDLVEDYQRSVGDISLIDEFSQLPPLRSVVAESDMLDEKIYFCARKDIPYGVIRVDGRYILLSPFLFNWEVDVLRNIVVHTLLLCALVASICTIFVLRRSFRPLNELSEAIRRVAKRDFTVRVNLHSSDEMGKICENFNWMTEELGHIEYLQRDFVSNVSHEFKTPLAAVQGSARMLSTLPTEKLTRDRLDKYIGMILDQTNRMTSLSSNLLRLSRLEHQTSAETVSAFFLDEQLRRAILLLENQWIAKKLQLDIQLEKVEFLGDSDLLYQVWSNLFSNAIKFSHIGGVLSVRMYVRDRKITVEIEDNGVGMSPEILRRLFEKFYQGDTSHKTEGNGLGLSIVKRILDLHQGEIYYESTLEKGTLCGVILPQILQESYVK